MDKQIRICDNCGKMIAKGEQYLQHKNGRILCIKCFKKIVLKEK